MNWKYTNEQRNVVYRVNSDGSMESCTAGRDDVLTWVAAGGGVVAPTLDDRIKAITAKYDAKKEALQRDTLRILAMDGPGMDAALAAIRAKWPLLADAEEEEIMNLFL